MTVFCSSNEGRFLECFIDGLEEAERYFVRASFGNLKGFGPFSASIPKSVIPSSWRSVQGKSPRIKNQLNVCQQLLTQLNQTSIEVSNIHEMVDSSGLPHKLLQILTLGAASGSVPKMHRNIHPHRVYLSLGILFSLFSKKIF